YRDVQNNRFNQRAEAETRLKDANDNGGKLAFDIEQGRQAGNNLTLNSANFEVAATKAQQDVELLTATQLADRQDRINSALRKAVDAYAAAAKVPGADKAGDALL